MKILFVLPYVPDLIRVRPFQLIRGLTRRGHEVVVACPVSSPGDLQSLKNLTALGIQTITRSMPPLRSLLNCACAVPTRSPLQSVYSWHPGLARDIHRFASEVRFDAIHVEHVRGVRYGLWLNDKLSRQSDKSANTPLIWDSVDCISNLFSKAETASVSRATRWITRIEQPRTAALEVTMPLHFDRVLFTAPADKQAVEDLARSRNALSYDNLRVLTNGVDLGYFSPDPDAIRETATIVMTGKMSYHANVATAKYLIEEVMPIVWRTRPDARVVIVGKNPPASLRALQSSSRVVITGGVSDVRPYLRKASVAAAPIVYGAGIQNKILEAMACGTPVITNSAGASALQARRDRDLMVASGVDDFGRQIVGLLQNPIVANELGRAGRRYVEWNHSWEAVVAQLESVYWEAIAARQTSPEGPRHLAHVA